MRFILTVFIALSFAIPTQAFNPAIYTPHTQYRAINHSQSKRVIKVRSNQRFVRRIPRYVKKTTHAHNKRQRAYEITDVKFVDGQRVGTTGIRKIGNEETDPEAETPVFGSNYGKERDRRIFTSRERRKIILGTRRNPKFKRTTNQSETQSEKNQSILWYGTSFKTRHPAKPQSGGNTTPIRALPVVPEGAAAPGAFPNNAEMQLSVINKSKGHVDGTSVEADIGDKLEFTIDFQSLEQGVHNFEAKVDVTNILNRAHVIEIERGYRRNNHVLFNAFSLRAPVQKTYKFTAEVHSCKEDKKFLTVVAQESAVNIPTACE